MPGGGKASVIHHLASDKTRRRTCSRDHDGGPNSPVFPVGGEMTTRCFSTARGLCSMCNSRSEERSSEYSDQRAQEALLALVAGADKCRLRRPIIGPVSP